MENKKIEKLEIEGVVYVPEGSANIAPTGEIKSLDDLIGKAFYFRTVTYHALVIVTRKISEKIVQLEKASWVADSGRFMQTIEKGELNEVEPVGVMFLNLDTVTDFFPWKHKLPTEQK